MRTQVLSPYILRQRTGEKGEEFVQYNTLMRILSPSVVAFSWKSRRLSGHHTILTSLG